jgi:hypothetical protein
MSERGIEDQDGYFTVWSGRHDPARVRILDLYFCWRDDSPRRFPPLHQFVNMHALRAPIPLLQAEHYRVLKSLPALAHLALTLGDGTPLPDALFEMDGLLGLSIQDDWLESAPDCFHAFPRLRELGLHLGRLVEPPPTVCSSPSLVELDLKHSQLARTPALAQATQLETLELGDNPLTSIEVDRLPPRLRSLASMVSAPTRWSCPTTCHDSGTSRRFARPTSAGLRYRRS